MRTLDSSTLPTRRRASQAEKGRSRQPSPEISRGIHVFGFVEACIIRALRIRFISGGTVMRSSTHIRIVFGTVTAMLVSSLTWVGAQQGGSAVTIDRDDIGGIVTSAKGPEAGVWVIAETTETPTRFSRTVVTDDRGRYVVPDLPTASYQVWVRGYGLDRRASCRERV